MRGDLQLQQLLQSIQQPPPAMDVADAIEEYQRNVNAIGASWLPRDLRNLAFKLNRAQMEERLKCA